jgi:Domain of unknown function (DUF1963)
MRKLGTFLSTAKSFLLAALATLFVLTLIWAAIETFTPFKVQPGSLRLGVVVLMVAVSAGLGAVVSGGAGRQTLPSTRGSLESVPHADPERLSRLTRAARANDAIAEAPVVSEPAVIAQPAAPAAPAEPAMPAMADPVVDLARFKPIVFRQAFPPASDQGLSYSGGVPTGPAELAWPRFAFPDGEAPLTFVMQWDCRALAAQDATGLLPREGVLYFFADLQWRHHEAFRFVHLTGEAESWHPVAPPADLQPLFGEQTAWQVPYCARHVPTEQQDCPVLLPKWPFTPLAFDYPRADVEEPEEEWIWGIGGIGERLIAVQDSLGPPSFVYNPDQPQRITGRPFPAFPHDWAAVRIVSAKVIDTLHHPGHHRLPKSLTELDEAARAATIADWLAEAIELYTFAASHRVNRSVPQDLSDQLWDWMAKVEGCFYPDQVIQTSVNTSLGLGSQALWIIPQDLIDRASTSHALGHSYTRQEYLHEFTARCGPGLSRDEAERQWNEAKAAGTLPSVRQIHANTPNRIFGLASDPQGDSEPFMADHLLLLEISSSSEIGIELGEGVVQYWIRPADLTAGRFDQVTPVASAY